jgi:hypothetical protein
VIARPAWPTAAGARDRSDGSQFVERLPDERSEVSFACVVDPALEGDLEDRDARLGRQARGGFGDAATTKCTGHGRGE